MLLPLLKTGVLARRVGSDRRDALKAMGNLAGSLRLLRCPAACVR